MKNLEKLFNSYKGIVLFYLLIAVLAFMITKKVEDINSQAEVETPRSSVTRYA